ncbi:hypothetical protein CKU_2497 [Staphylococcus aureus]|nr:hypothetical protein CKU_2497 [Staphylococcus aureus]
MIYNNSFQLNTYSLCYGRSLFILQALNTFKKCEEVVQRCCVLGF